VWKPVVVDVRSDRRYGFGVGPQELWAALVRVEEYPRWWPWLRDFRAHAFAPGARWECVVQPPLPYAVRFRLRLGDVVAPTYVTASIEGDIDGEARLDVSATATGSELRLVSCLRPRSSLLRTVAGMVPPVARFGHEWVLDTGVRQFRAHAF
jgi:uncharacterized protein YndB with AHSA1/START domain